MYKYSWKSYIASAGLVWFTCVSASPVNAQPAPVTAALREKETETVDLGQGVTMDFVLIHPGSFQMGSNRNDYDEQPVHQVTLGHAYYLGKYEVTQEQWEKVMGDNPSHFKGAKLPVENVSWDDCQRFVAALRKKTGRNFALPTEAQWEYACRAGTTTTYSFGDDDSRLGEHGWYASNSDLRTHPVGQKKPNPWGFYDMHGNVFEWCADWYSESYDGGEATDPTGPATGDRRIIRGGAWLYVSDNLRSADRGFSPPDYRVNEYGLRCVLLAGETATAKTVAEPASVKPAPETLQIKEADSAAALLVQLDAALADENKYYAESLLAQVGKLAPGDARIADLRGKVAALPAPKESLTVDLAEGISMEFVLVHPGSFIMGSEQSPALDERPTHRVTIARPYYLGKYEVTQKQWVALMSRNLSSFKGNPQMPDASTLPVENVSWLLCQTFLSQLNQKSPAYHFRLPTEAEWEYACRAGTTGDVHLGEGASLDDYAWYGVNSGGKTHPAGGKKPNAWGLYDMYGNVWEWCQDPFEPYPSEPQIDPAGPINSDSGMRVLRGGAWNNTADHVNSTFRHDAGEDLLLPYYGFRCVAETKPRKEKVR